MRVRFLQDKVFSRDGVSVVRVRAGDEAEVTPRLAARYLAEGVAVDAAEVKALPVAPENKADGAPARPAARRGGRRKGAGGA